jgi:hypothetical protein
MVRPPRRPDESPVRMTNRVTNDDGGFVFHPEEDGAVVASLRERKNFLSQPTGQPIAFLMLMLTCQK